MTRDPEVVELAAASPHAAYARNYLSGTRDRVTPLRLPETTIRAELHRRRRQGLRDARLARRARGAPVLRNGVRNPRPYRHRRLILTARGLPQGAARRGRGPQRASPRTGLVIGLGLGLARRRRNLALQVAPLADRWREGHETGADVGARRRREPPAQRPADRVHLLRTSLKEFRGVA